MIPDAFLRLAENQTAVGTAGTTTDNIIDLGVARNIGVGEPLIAVINIRTTFASAGADDPLVQWVFYASDLSTKGDSATAQELGRSAIYSCNVAGFLVNNLKAGQKICVPLLPVTAVRASSGDLGATPIPTKGRRYVYGGFVVTGAQFTAGTFDVEIGTHAHFGGGAAYSDVPIYPTGITIA